MKKSRAQRKIENRKLKYDNERLQKTCNSLSEDIQFWIEKGTKEKQRADKFEKKYFDKLKHQMEYNHKDVVNISLMINRQTPYDEMQIHKIVSQEQIDEYYKRTITQMLAESLYNNFECLRKTESHIGTRIDLLLLKWNDEQARQEYEEMKKYMEP
jgi:cupin superfamily acireductone dioxygenase involved in methionine salvage